MSDRNRDNDMPFNLPIEPGYEPDDDPTDDLQIPAAYSKLSPAEIARLQAEDHASETMDPNALTESMTGVPPVQRNTGDDDVPFHLPQDDGEHSDQPIRNKWNTLPSERTPYDQTLPGSGGLDPNPDFSAPHDPNATIQNMHPISGQQTMQSRVEHVRYQRPASARPAIPVAPPVGPMQNPSATNRTLPQRRKKKSSGIGCFAIFLGLFVTFCGGITLLMTILGAVAYTRVDELLDEQIARLDSYQNFESTFIYDRNGETLFEVFNEGRRTNVHLADMPQYLIDATIAIEDDSFYDNIGIDVGATTVALLQYLGAGSDGDSAGGSTITQQLVRNVLFDPEYRAERSAKRKAEEIALAMALTARRSKDDILEMYLNEIYYGNLAYGVQAAAQIFFGKNVGDLTLGEAALLAGLPQAPAELNPLDPDPAVRAAVVQRWRQVLTEMVEEGNITQAQMDAALAEGISFADPNINLLAPHFTVYAQDELESLMGELGYSAEQIALGGLQVYTTVDLSLTEQVTQIAAGQIAAIPASSDVSNAAVLVIKPLTGEILAMVGSIDYNNDAIDGRVNVVTRPRQPGSTMKAFTYSAALELGMTAGDVIWDTRISVPQPGQAAYVPRNYDGAVHGPMRMRRALANSFNIPAIQTMRYVTVDYLLQYLYRFGVRSLGLDSSLYGVSLTLGGGEITLEELTQGYGVFANQGVLVPTTSILCVLDNDNSVIYEYENGCPATDSNRNPVTRNGSSVIRRGFGEAVLDPRIAYLITDILSDNSARAEAFTATSDLYTPGINTSVKTGTTNDIKDNWTVGYTANVAVGVWVGNNDGRPMRNTSGVTGAAPIWNDVMTMIYNNPAYMDMLRVDGSLQPDKPNAPGGMSNVALCNVTSIVDPTTACSKSTSEWLLDSPAYLPDGNGNLVAQAYFQAPQEIVPPTGSYVQQVEPGIYRTVVMELNPAVANAIQFQVAAGETAPPAPKYCRVPMEAVSSTPGVQELLFLAPPLYPSDAAEAEIYARSRGLAFLPTIDCTGELLAGGAYGGGSAPVVTAIITSPASNEIVSGAIAILGTAQFTPEQAAYYKIEIIGGQWADWTTIQDVSTNSVVNGQLGYLPALPTGSYQLKLVLIGNDGNLLQQPYVVNFSVP